MVPHAPFSASYLPHTVLHPTWYHTHKFRSFIIFTLEQSLDHDPF